MRNLYDLPDGIYYDISEDEYQTDKTRIRAGQLKSLADGSDYDLTIKKKFEGSNLGIAFHNFLETKTTNRILNMQTYTATAGYGTKKNEAFISEHKDNICLNDEDYDKFTEMITVYNNRRDTETDKLRGLLNDPDAKREVTVLFSLEGIKCKARIDFLLEKNGVWHIADHKTTSAGSIDDFTRDYFSKHYYLQMYSYALGLMQVLNIDFDKIKLLMFTYQTKEPYVFHTYEIIDEDTESVFTLIYALTFRVNQVLTTGKYNGYIPAHGKKYPLSLNNWQLAKVKQLIKTNLGE